MSSVGNSTLPVKIAFFDIDGTLLPLGVREPSAKIVNYKEMELFSVCPQEEAFWQGQN